MPNELHQRIPALTASIGFNDGANKGFWRFQPREKFGEGAGQWIEMGAELRMFFKNKRGKTDSVTGKAVGSTGSQDGVRVLVQGQSKKGVPDGIYGADTANVRIAEGILPEDFLERQGIKNVPQISKEQEAALPTIDQLERADITDGDIRLINEGAESAEAKQQAEYKKSVESKEKKAAPEKAEAAKPQDDIKPTKPISLDRGDVVRLDDGTEGTIVDLRLDTSMGGKSFMRVQTADGEVKTVELKDLAQPVNVVKGKKGRVSKPAKPAKPAPKPVPKAEEKPEAPAPAPEPTPEPISAPEPEPEPAAEEDRSALIKPENTIAPATPANFPPVDRVDDGSDIEMGRLSEDQVAAARKKRALPLLGPDGVPQAYKDENGNSKPASDPFSLMSVLAEVFPNAKFTKDGLSLVLARRKDKDGRIFELRASSAGQKVISYSMRWTDPKTGAVEELFHYDTRHSVQALFSKANGPDGLMDRLLGRGKWAELKHGNWKRGPEASLRERAEWFVLKQKMFTGEDMALTMADGRTETYHMDERNYGRIRKSEIKSTWDAVKSLFDGPIDESLKDEIYLRLEKIMSSVPSTDLAHKLVMKALRAEYKRRFGSLANDQVDKTFTALLTNASMHAKGKSFKRERDPGFRANPYASANRHTPLKEGMVVEYVNNEGKVSTLRIVSKHVNFSTAAGKNNDVFDFGDYVKAIDANGRLKTFPSTELRILGDQNTPLTPYIPNLVNQALLDYRIRTGKVRDPRISEKSMPAGEKFAVSTPRSEPEFTALVDDLIPGDDIYDEKGTLLGEIVAVEPTQDDDGNDGFAFLISDAEGDEFSVFYPQGTEVSSGVDIPEVTTAKEAEEGPEDTVFYRMMAEDVPLSSSINPVPDASSIDAPVGEPAEDSGGKNEVQSTKSAVEKVLSVMLEALKNGEVPWRKPFTDDPRLAGAALPRNPKTKHIYTGTNRLVLNFVAQMKGYEDGRWLTYKQADGMGGQVRRGEKGTFILVPRIIPIKGKDGKPELDSNGKPKSFVKFDTVAVFNVEQIDGLNLEDDMKNVDLQAKTPLEAQEFVLARYLKSMEALGLEVPKIRYTYVGEYGSHSSSPNWSPMMDVITLPTLEQFNSPEEIFDTLMHELAHSTGHRSRLDRTALTADYGNPDGVARAKEELIAEISSALLQQMFGITSSLDNSAAYVQSWLKRLQNNPEEVVNATKEAQKVVDYMLGIHLGDWSPVDGYTSAKGALPSE